MILSMKDEDKKLKYIDTAMLSNVSLYTQNKLLSQKQMQGPGGQGGEGLDNLSP